MNYRAVPAGRELDKLMAVNLGFTVEYTDKPGYGYHGERDIPGYILRGKYLHKNLWSLRFTDEADAWDHIGSYSDDETLARAVVERIPYTVELWHWGLIEDGGWSARIVVQADDEVYARGETFSLVCCRIFLALMEHDGVLKSIESESLG